MPRPESLAAFIALADGDLTDLQQSAALKQAATVARTLRDYAKADELTALIPIEAEKKTAIMLNLLAQRKAALLIEQFGGEDLTNWPFWAAGEGYFARGRAYAAVGSAERATADYRAALELTSDKRVRDKILQALQQLPGN